MSLSISVIIPWHMNYAALERAVKSVLAQTFAAAEIIIVCNGASASEADALAKRYKGARFRVIRRLEPNANIARNAGIMACTSSHCALLDCDDEFTEDKLEVLRDAFRTRPRGIFFSRGRRIISPGVEWDFPRRGPRSGELLSEYFFCSGNFISSSAICGSTDTLRRVLFDPEVKKYQDLDILIRAQLGGEEVHFLEEVTFLYHDETDYGRISKANIFEHLTLWGSTYSGFSSAARSAFLARAVAQHQLPRHFIRNSSLIASGYIRGSIGLIESFGLFARFFLPSSITKKIIRYRARRD